MRRGDRINKTENRPVLHVALRARKDEQYLVDGVNVVHLVHEVLQQIKAFAEALRSGAHKGASGKPLVNVVCIGIGGSYLGGEFVIEALRSEPHCEAAAKGRRIRFLANVDPVDFHRAVEGLEPESTLFVVISKTFTTAETMQNARLARDWLTKKLGDKATAKHMVAVSSAQNKVQEFGIDPKNTFVFWDWVGGRYSVTSAVGILPIALHYGFDVAQRFLDGARSIDLNFFNAPPRANLPLLLGLLGVWNSTFLGYSTRSIACYSQALHRFAAHIQQVDMESNGKSVTVAGAPVPHPTGEINFGEPGTNAQHSYFQLFHQGRVVPLDFIGFIDSQQPAELKDEPAVHDQLMANFFAQPDALAVGINEEELRKEGVKEELIPHKVMPGNRPSNVLLLQRLDAYAVGQLLALYEHRTAVQGFVWGINSFDQFGVELGKVLATKVLKQLCASRRDKADVRGFNPSTALLLKRYLAGRL